MTDKVTLNNLAIFDPSINAVINNNNAAITTAMDNTLSRDGTSPNQMNADLDMNSKRILNLPIPVNVTEPVRLQELINFNGGVGIVGPVGPVGPTGATGASGVNGVLSNARLAKTANYTVLNADKGTTIALGGGTAFTLTLNAASGYDANFAIMVINEDATAAKKITIAGLTSFFLWPGQIISIYNSNNVWKTTGPYRWSIGSVNFYVDSTNGSDSNDGLAPGAGRALQHISFGVAFIQSQLDLIGGTANLNLANGTYTESFTIFGGPTGGLEINIIGNPGSPSSVVFNGTLSCRDGGILSINGVKFTSTGGQCLLVGQEFIVDLQNIEWGTASGVHLQVNSGGYINFVGGTYTVSGNFLFHIQMNGQGSIFQIPIAQTISVPNALTFTTWLFNSTGYVVFAGGCTFTGTGAGAGSAGKKFDTNFNGVTSLGGATLPGNVAGTSTTGGITV